MKVSELKQYLNQVDDDFELCVNVYKRTENNGCYPLETVETTNLDFSDIAYSDKKIVLSMEIKND